ncbi:ADP-ribosylhydrolase ARH1 isoform X2 [Bombina bombina]|uniref:ADP-ribosylhydrolase ARH1 isoform X2 n=1 Tax=Bombina bombina TaxID=8345 RepID=UPI00235AD20A|nr:ADP-ribosylhydrolase ARH1 isoform X2 [Bombina bombina]XP_053550867.1 ADP-ribosylhydrolase ARH1 isoform X2 [Bombina bombina]XP_053550868.1 ADP-ribosylhydrolase ARH1 isoform X2 [Bombina bombina]
MDNKPPSRDLYRAALLLSAAGDALGYRNQLWEYCKSGPQILKELQELGGLSSLRVTLPDWPISDDTVLHLATAEGLATGKLDEDLYQELAGRYVSAMLDMEGRKPGPTSILGTSQLRPGEPGGYKIPFNPTATGCGAAMRAMCIGLRFPRPSEVSVLVAVSIESGKMTHNHPTGYLGSLASALFVSLSVQRVPLELWGSRLLETLPLALEYIRSTESNTESHLESWDYFRQSWERYLSERGLLQGSGPAVFPSPYGAAERDIEYSRWSLDGWPGRSGHDAPMIAYDALLSAGESWEELCHRSMFHGGDSDSTGVIAGCCWGALYGFLGVPEGNYNALEYRERLEAAADHLHKLAWGNL